jgi:hypothetical protein
VNLSPNPSPDRGGEPFSPSLVGKGPGVRSALEVKYPPHPSPLTQKHGWCILAIS